MDGQRRFAVIGTDARLAAAGRALARAGFAVGGPEQTALADYILLPLPLDESRTPSACPTGPKPASRMALFQSVRVRSAIRMPMQPSAVGMALQRISSSRAK